MPRKAACASACCRLAEEEILKHITTTDSCIQRPEALELLRSWYFSHPRAMRAALTHHAHSQAVDFPTARGVQLDSSRYYISQSGQTLRSAISMRQD